MSMPLRFAVSEKPATILPLAGHAQSSASLSPLVAGAGDDDVGGPVGAAFGSGFGSARTAGGVASATESGGAGTALAANVRSRTAWSEYGSLIALGDVLVEPD